MCIRDRCCSTSSTQPKCMGSTRRTCRVESSQVEFGLNLLPRITAVCVAAYACKVVNSACRCYLLDEDKYANIGSQYLFALSRSKPWPSEHVSLPTICQCGKKDILNTSGDEREWAFLLQRVSVLAQRYNAVLLHDTLPAPDCTDFVTCIPNCVYLSFKSPSGSSLPRSEK